MNGSGEEVGEDEYGPEIGRGRDPALARSILEHAHEAFVSMDAGGFITDWNPEAERTFGWPREEVLGRVLADTIVPERYRDAHWNGLKHYLETGEGPVLGQRLELSALHREGHEFPIELTIASRSAGSARFDGLLHDISARKFSERLLVAQDAVTRALASAATPAEAMQALLPALGESLGWELGAYWAADPEEQALRRAASWRAPTITAEEFERESGELRVARGIGPLWRTWEQGEPLWVDEITVDTGFLRMATATRDGLHAAIYVPVLRDDEVVGVIEFFTRELRTLDRSVSDSPQWEHRQVTCWGSSRSAKSCFTDSRRSR